MSICRLKNTGKLFEDVFLKIGKKSNFRFRHYINNRIHKNKNYGN